MNFVFRLFAAFGLFLLGIGNASAHPEHSSTVVGGLIHAMLAPDHGLPFVLGIACVVAMLRMARLRAAGRGALLAVYAATLVSIGWMAASLL